MLYYLRCGYASLMLLRYFAAMRYAFRCHYAAALPLFSLRCCYALFIDAAIAFAAAELRRLMLLPQRTLPCRRLPLRGAAMPTIFDGADRPDTPHAAA